jgi:hypothetical protein
MEGGLKARHPQFPQSIGKAAGGISKGKQGAGTQQKQNRKSRQNRKRNRKTKQQRNERKGNA